MDLRATVRRPLAASRSKRRVPGILPGLPRRSARPPGVPPATAAVAIAAAGVAGVVAGGALMYLLDPDRGRRRRARVRDKTVHYAHEAADGTGRTARDVRNRGRGLVARAGSAVRPWSVSSDRLEKRVRAKVGRRAGQVDALHVHAEGDRVTISGPVRRTEAEAIRAAVGSVRGVGMVEDRLEVHEDPGDVRGLQGTG